MFFLRFFGVCHLINFIIIRIYNLYQGIFHQFYAFLITDWVSGDSSPAMSLKESFFFLKTNSQALNSPKIKNKIIVTNNTFP